MASLYLDTSAVAELECTHEEADTRMLFYAVRTSSNGFQAIAICSPDTDVAVLAVVLWSCAGSLWKDHPCISGLAQSTMFIISMCLLRDRSLGQENKSVMRCWGCIP